MRTMKPETEIRELKREVKRLRALCVDSQDVNREERQATQIYRERASKAERDVAEWKRRFDILLSKCRSFEPTEPIP